MVFWSSGAHSTSTAGLPFEFPYLSVDECITSVSVRAGNHIGKLRVTSSTYGFSSSSRAILFTLVGDGDGLRTRAVSEPMVDDGSDGRPCNAW